MSSEDEYKLTMVTLELEGCTWYNCNDAHSGPCSGARSIYRSLLNSNHCIDICQGHTFQHQLHPELKSWKKIFPTEEV